MPDSQHIAAIVSMVVAGLIATAFIIHISRRSGAIRDMIRNVAAASGWADIRNKFGAAGVKGTWRSFPIELFFAPRQKGIPQRMILRVVAQSDAALVVKRKFAGVFSNRPLTWFGPPIVELHQPAASELWVRGDAALAERLFSDSKLAALIASNLVARYDEVRLSARGLRITRALDERIVRTKYAMVGFRMSFKPEEYEPIAREELQLAEAMVNALRMSS